MADGTFAGIVTEAVQPAGRGAGSVKLITSSDGGRTLNPAVIVSNRDIQGMGGPRDIPSLAVDASPSAFHDRLYVVWPDKRFFGRTRILISYSIGQGQSWSYPKPVDRGLWDLTPALINNVLPARGTSAERTFKVHLTHVVAPVGWGQRALELYGRVLAGGG